MKELFQRLFRRSSITQDVGQELETHLAMRAELNEQSGMTPEEAYASARRQFGNSTAVRERVYDLTGFGWLDTLWRNLVYALRGIRRQPGVSATAVLTIAIGTGAVAGMFNVTRNLILAPPPHVTAPDRVFHFRQVFWEEGAEGEPFGATSYPFFELLSERAQTLEAVGAYSETALPAGSGIDAAMAEVVMVSSGFWETLGVNPEIGRFIDDSEAHPVTGARVAVLGHPFWQSRFGGDSGIVGQTLEVKGQPYTIVGVAPRGFRGVELQDVDLWLPLFAQDDGSGRQVTWHTLGNSYALKIALRLTDGATPAEASAELTNLQRAFLEDAYTPMLRRGAVDAETYRRSRSLLGPVTGGLGDNLRPIPEARVAVWLLGVAVVFILIACANVAGLLLLRALRRRREIAVRLALGISRRQLALQLLTESSLLAMLGGTAAILAQIWGGAWLQRTVLPAMAWEPAAAVHTSVLAVAAVSTLGTALVAGMAPLYFLRANALKSLREGPSAAMARRPRMQGVLVAVQGTLSVVLLVGAGLFLRSLYNLETVDMGLDRENVLVVQVDFSRTGMDTGRAAFFERALDRVSVLPGVSRASVTIDVPLHGARAGGFGVSGRDGDDISAQPYGLAFRNAVTPGFFQTTGMRVVEGRAFDEADRSNGKVVIVNERLARLAWPDRSPIGQCAQLNQWPEDCATVVGVVADARSFSAVEDDAHASFYTPLPVNVDGPRALLVRTADGAGRIDSMIRDALFELDSGLPYIGVELLGDILDPQIRPWRLGASVFTAFGVLAVVLAMIGLWSSVSYAVSQRRQEFAIRLAVGASRKTLINRVLGDGLRNALVSVAAGVLIAGLTSSFIADLLFGVSPHDPLVFGTIAGVILVVSTLASLFPAWRAANVRPAEALRAE